MLGGPTSMTYYIQDQDLREHLPGRNRYFLQLYGFNQIGQGGIKARNKSYVFSHKRHCACAHAVLSEDRFAW